MLKLRINKIFKIFFLITFISLISVTKADYQLLKEQLQQVGVDIKKIENMKTVSRYDVARLLNIVNCFDCRTPPKEMLQTYDQKYRKEIKNGEEMNLKDIKFPQNIRSGENYFYCVAYVADKNLMRGYPENISPICKGEFCGERPINYAEFYQVLSNFLVHFVYQNYELDRKKVKKRLDQQNLKNLDITDEEIKIIKKNSEICDKTCFLTNYKEMQIWLLYCNENPNDKNCKLQTFSGLKKGRPLAQINFLLNHNILTLSDINTNIGDFVDGETLITALSAVIDYQQCKFNGDYDLDGIDNFKDNCPYDCNPNQGDIDNDGIGDVCDEDVDGDGIKNKIGIIDDEGNIQMGIWMQQTQNQDNCPTTPNPQQIPSKKYPKIGQKCSPSEEKNIYFSIQTTNLGNNTINFKIVSNADKNFYDGQNISRFFGDGTFGKGENVYHVYSKNGKFNISAIIPTNKGKQKIQTSINLGNKENLILNQKIQKIPNKIGEECNFLVESSQNNFFDIQYGVNKLSSFEKNKKIPANFAVTIQNNKRNNIYSLIIANSQQYLLSSLLRIKNTNQCLLLRNKNKLNYLKCDLDKDGIPDLCDDDIDGDGIKNLANLVIFEYPDCHFDKKNVNQILYQKEKNSLCLDKIPLGNIELSGSSVSELCPNDKDCDKIPDNVDVCPEIPETYNNLQDTDGCPEIQNPKCNLNGICEENEDCSCEDCDCKIEIDCNQCPCPDTKLGGIPEYTPIRAILLSPEKNIIYSISPIQNIIFK